MTTIDDLRDWNVAFVMTTGTRRRAFIQTVPATDWDAAAATAHGLAWAINEGSGHVWKTTDEVSVEEAS